MSNGPIEWMGEHPAQVTPASEYGGASGLIQPEPHPLTASEASNALMRAAMYTDDDGDLVVDPFTGRIVPPDMNAQEA
jgi:hypothetical protein